MGDGYVICADGLIPFLASVRSVVGSLVEPVERSRHDVYSVT